MKKRIQILIIVILYALMFVPLSAQTPHTISGIVKDRASVPISGVNIRVEGQKWKASTGKEGTNIKAYNMTIIRICILFFIISCVK